MKNEDLLAIAERLLTEYMLPLKNQVMKDTRNQDKKIAAEDLLYKLDHIYKELTQAALKDTSIPKWEFNSIGDKLEKAFENVRNNLTKHNKKFTFIKGNAGKVKAALFSTVSVKDILAKYEGDIKLRSVFAESKQVLRKQN